jgi:hypothetical protein
MAIARVPCRFDERESAIEHLLEALRLRPRDPHKPSVFLALAMARLRRPLARRGPP